MANHLFADTIAELLRDGYSVRFCASGNSMQPAIKDGEVITIKPVIPSQVKRGDIVLYRNHNGVIAHRVVAINQVNTQASGSGEQETCGTSILNPQSSTLRTLFTLRGDASTTCDEPVEMDQILAKVLSVERAGRLIELDNRKSKMLYTARFWICRLKRLVVQCIIRMKAQWQYDPHLTMGEINKLERDGQEFAI